MHLSNMIILHLVEMAKTMMQYTFLSHKHKEIEGVCLNQKFKPSKEVNASIGPEISMYKENNYIAQNYLFPKEVSICKGEIVNTCPVIYDLKPKL